MRPRGRVKPEWRNRVTLSGLLTIRAFMAPIYVSVYSVIYICICRVNSESCSSLQAVRRHGRCGAAFPKGVQVPLSIYLDRKGIRLDS